MDETKITASLIDDLPFPYLREYDLNLWIDDDGFLRASAYALCLEKSENLDEDGEPTYRPANYACADQISLLCVHEHEYLGSDREAIFADLDDEWDTTSGFLSQPQAWTKKYPDLYQTICDAIREELMDEFGTMDYYEACQHA
jgi:hypothetical protein